MPYHVGAKGSSGCSGYPAVKTGTGEVMGCHKTRREAAAQIYAINRSEGKVTKAMIKEGDMVIAPDKEGSVHVGRVVHVMTDGMLGFPGSEYSIAASAEEPAILIQLFEMEEGGLDETEYFVGHKASEVMQMPSIESNIGMDKAYQGCDCSMCKEKNISCADCPNCQNQMDKQYEGCGCPTCKELNVSCENCPVCSEDMAKGNHNHSMDKREFSGKTRERMAESGTAMPDGSFPIANRNDLMNAIRSVGRAKNYAAAKEHIVSRARALGLIDMLPEDWKKGVRKTMWGGTVFDLNPFVK